MFRFEKVFFENFLKDFKDCWDRKNLKTCLSSIGHPSEKVSMEELAKYVYDRIELPQRGTRGSAGYDFKYPLPISISAGEKVAFPSGIAFNYTQFPSEVATNRIVSLWLVPRSSYVFKGITLANSVFIIDPDYYDNEKNGGDILVFMKNVDSFNVIKENDAYMQGLVTVTELAEGDYYMNDYLPLRTGGVGSTSTPEEKLARNVSDF